MVTSSAGMVPPEPESGCSSDTVSPARGVASVWTTTWKDSNSFRAAVSDALGAPVTTSVGRTFTAEPTTTTDAEADAPAGPGSSRPMTSATVAGPRTRTFLTAEVCQDAPRDSSISPIGPRTGPGSPPQDERWPGLSIPALRVCAVGSPSGSFPAHQAPEVRTMVDRHARRPRFGWALLLAPLLALPAALLPPAPASALPKQGLEFTTGNAPDSVAIGDLNGDGLPDLALANRFSDTVSVLPGNGDG